MYTMHEPWDSGEIPCSKKQEFHLPCSQGNVGVTGSPGSLGPLLSRMPSIHSSTSLPHFADHPLSDRNKRVPHSLPPGPSSASKLWHWPASFLPIKRGGGRSGSLDHHATAFRSITSVMSPGGLAGWLAGTIRCSVNSVCIRHTWSW